MPATAWLTELRKALARPPALLRVETVTIDTRWSLNFHATPSHELCHVLQGHARIEYQKRRFHVGPGDTFLIPCDTAHRDIYAGDEDYRVLYVFFQWPGAERLLKGLSPDLLLGAPSGAKQHLHLMLKELEAEYSGERDSALLHMHIQLLEILLALARYAHRPEPAASAPRRMLARRRRSLLATLARQYLLVHHEQRILLEDLAAKLRVSPFHLSRIFSREFGVSIIEMLTAIRVEHAQELLREGRISVKEVAGRNGFADANYFAKVFRRRVGISPTAFQARAQHGQRNSRPPAQQP